MKPALICLSLAAILALVGVSIWATGHIAISPVIADLSSHPGDSNNPWLVATLFDAYFGFFWFWAWVAYKETSWVARIVWLLLILLFGNMAMGTYMLIKVLRLPADATVRDLLLRSA